MDRAARDLLDTPAFRLTGRLCYDALVIEEAALFGRLFRDHPTEIGETYVEHLAAAGGFGVKMIAGGIACVVHAVVPGLFITTGSGTVKKLYDQMVAKRAAKRDANIEMRSIEYVI